MAATLPDTRSSGSPGARAAYSPRDQDAYRGGAKARVGDNAEFVWIVRGERVGLVAPRKEEFLDRWDLSNDPILGMLVGLPALPGAPHGGTLPPYSREQHEKLWESIAARNVIAFDIREAPDGRLVGEAFLTRLWAPHGSCELSLVVLDPADRRKHFAIDALRLVCGYAFDVLGANRIVLRTLAVNRALLEGFERHGESIGARRVGVEREALWAFGDYQDVVLIEILKRDFPPQEDTAHLRRPPS
jgi:RimJ/RimL family protein N-acetyltransferase